MRTSLLVSLALNFLGLVSVDGLSCLDNSGKSVPWWLMVKLPKLSKEKDDRVASGFSYAYVDTNSPAGKPLQLWPNTMDDKTNACALTRSLSQLVSSTEMLEDVSIEEVMRLRNLRGVGASAGGASFAMYNDQPHSGDKVSSGYGHSKGVIAYDGNSGIWLPHSTPEFPNTSKKADFWFPEDEVIYGQYFFCISLTTADLDQVAENMKYIRPYFFYDGFSAPHKKSLPNLAEALDGTYYSDAATNVATFKAVGDSMTFTHLAKNVKWNGNLWSELVAPTLKEDFYVESWIRGSAVGNVCKPYKVLDVAELHVDAPANENGDGWNWLESQDHAKWGVGLSATKKWFCVGDINRMTTQEKRGGGALCFQDAVVWGKMSGAVVDHEKC
jgi:deoxyribonuclease-2